MYRKHLYFISLILQVAFVMVSCMSFGYAYAISGGDLPISDYMFMALFIVILFLFTMYHYKSPYHEMKSAIYLNIYYFAPLILVGLYFLMSGDFVDSQAHIIDQVLQYIYLINGFVLLVSIIGKEI